MIKLLRERSEHPINSFQAIVDIQKLLLEYVSKERFIMFKIHCFGVKKIKKEEL